MGVLTMIAQLVLSLSILVVLHEAGHFIPAKLFKTRVEKFYLFFDPWFSLVKKKIGETEYGIGWLPLGGYVKISGMIDESMDKEQMAQPPQPWEFRSKPAWQRLVIMLGGVTVNFVLGFFIFGMIMFVYGESYLPSENVKYGIAVDTIGYEMGLRDGDIVSAIGDQPFDKFEPGQLIRGIVLGTANQITVKRDSRTQTIDIDPKYQKFLASSRNSKYRLMAPRMPFEVAELTSESAKSSGLQIGDKIVTANGQPARYMEDFRKVVKGQTNTKVTIGYERDGRTGTAELMLNKNGRMGVTNYPADHYFTFETQNYTLGEALPRGVDRGWSFLTDQFKAFGQMFKGNIDPSETLGGFGTITKLFPETWEWQSFWRVTAILSLILGFMNLLPIPALDGGHVMFLIGEVVTGKKPSDKVMEYSTMIGFAIVLALVVYANGLDIWRWFQG